MTDETTQNPELATQAATIVAGNAPDVVATISQTTDPELLAAIKSAEQSGKERVSVLNALDAALNPAPAATQYVSLKREQPQFEGGPVTASVHPDEVANYLAGDWQKA